MNNLDSGPDHPKTLMALAGIGSFVAAELDREGSPIKLGRYRNKFS